MNRGRHYVLVGIEVIRRRNYILAAVKVLEYMQVTGGLHQWDYLFNEPQVLPYLLGNLRLSRRVTLKAMDNFRLQCHRQPT